MGAGVGGIGGVTGRPSLSIEELLTRYERYDTRRRAAHVPHPSRAGFIDGFEDAGLGKSKQTLYNYEEHYNLPWPLLPEDAGIFAWVLFGQDPFDLTWVRQSVAAALARPVDQIVGKPSIELLRHGVPLGDDVIASMRRLKEDPTLKVTVVDEPVELDVAYGHAQLARMEVRYTGAKFDRFFVTAQPIGVPYPAKVDTSVFNVVPDVIFEMKQEPAEPVLSRFRLIREQADQQMARARDQAVMYEDSLIAFMSRLQKNPELMREYLNRTLPKYEYPGDAKT